MALKRINKELTDLGRYVYYVVHVFFALFGPSLGCPRWGLPAKQSALWSGVSFSGHITSHQPWCSWSASLYGIDARL